MNTDTLSGAAGVALSLAFSYIPGLSDTYERQDATTKRLVMAILLIAVVVVVFILGCSNIYGLVTCDQPGAIGLLKMLLAALVANQATYLISPPKAAKLP